MRAHPSPRARVGVLVALSGILAAALAGCGGSAIDPVTAAKANDLGVRGSGTGQPVAVSTAGTGNAPGGEGVVPGAKGPAGGTSTGGPAGPGGTGRAPAPAVVAKGVSCAGFKNGTGITSSTIRVGNASDISGPVPGLFTAAQQASRAFIQYFTSTGGTICGRKLQLDLYDTHTDGGGDQQSYTKGCATDFAMVGSMSAFDSGGARTAQACGIPDLRAISTTNERGACTTCFGTQPAGPEAFENAVPDYLIKHTGGKNAAMLYIDIGASAANGKSQVRHETKRGVHYVVNRGVDVAEFNYSPYVQEMKDKNVQSVQFIASSAQFARMAQAMKAADFHPKVFLIDPSAYNDDYTSVAGDAGIGTVVYVNFTPFEEAAGNPEMQLYMRYLQQVAPGAKPTFFGLFAWSATRLFVEQAVKLGGRLSRPALVQAVRHVDGWTSHGAHAPQHVGSKKIADCWRFIKWTGRAWVPEDGRAYHCNGLTY